MSITTDNIKSLLEYFYHFSIKNIKNFGEEKAIKEYERIVRVHADDPITMLNVRNTSQQLTYNLRQLILLKLQNNNVHDAIIIFQELQSFDKQQAALALIDIAEALYSRDDLLNIAKGHNIVYEHFKLCELLFLTSRKLFPKFEEYSFIDDKLNKIQELLQKEQPTLIDTDFETLVNVFKYKNDFEFWGFYDCYYLSVERSLNSNPPPPKRIAIDITTTNSIKALCKNELVNFVYENAARVQEGKPIAKIIFCLGRDEPKFSIHLNLRNVAESHSIGEASSNTSGEYHITDSELRRCLKLCFEADPRIRKIAQNSFAFAKLVRVKEKDSYKPYYTFVELKPFWEDEDFKQSWAMRKRHAPKLESWNTILTNKLDSLYANQTATLFAKTPNIEAPAESQPKQTRSHLRPT